MQMQEVRSLFSRRTRYICFVSVMLPVLQMSTPESANAQHLAVQTSDYLTLGNPTSAIEAADGRYVFVSVTNVGAPNFTGSDASAGARKDVVSGIQVFRVQRHKLVASGFIRTGSAGANGLALLRGGKTLVVGVGDEGVAFLDVKEIESGTAVAHVVSQGEKAGAFDVAATPDGKFVFSANEYGVVDGRRGNVGVIATGIDANGRVLAPKSIQKISVGDVVPSLTISHDGRRVYVATELVPPDAQISIAGGSNPSLTKTNCIQAKGSPARGNGYISVIDVPLATADSSNRDAITARIAAGCSPVRIAESIDGSGLFVTARGDNTVLEYDASLLNSDPEHAFHQAFPSGGEAPVGLRLFDRDRFLAVANSNRFAEGPGTVAILRVTNQPTLLKTLPAKLFPRNISEVGKSGELFLTNYSSRSITEIIVSASKEKVAAQGNAEPAVQ